MSTTNANPAEPFALLPADQAANGVTEGVYAEAFFHKLAEVVPQFQPRNRAEALSLLEMGVALDELPEPVQKSASENRFAAPAQAIFGVLSNQGVAVPQLGKQAEDEACVAIAAHLLSNPAVYQVCGSAMVHKFASIAEAQSPAGAPAAPAAH